jgi:hypothetical protein
MDPVRCEERNKNKKRILVSAACFCFGLVWLISVFVVIVLQKRGSIGGSKSSNLAPSPLRHSLPPTLPPIGDPPSPHIAYPYSSPTKSPLETSSSAPSSAPSAKTVGTTTSAPTQISYIPGNLSVSQLGLRLSTGLSVKRLTGVGELVQYGSGKQSLVPFHASPDMGATFVDTRSENEGGWIYVSNSEVQRPWGMAGVGALTFDKNGVVMDYRMVLKNTTANCGGGRTKWNTWISCEEYTEGRLWHVDPTGAKAAVNITLGYVDRGVFESFAYDARYSHYFVTEDHEFGPVRRFIPVARHRSSPWEELFGAGNETYLRLIPASDSNGTYAWVKDKDVAKLSANAFYPNAEGIEVDGNLLYFVSKRLKTMFILNLDDRTYTSSSTRFGCSISPKTVETTLVFTGATRTADSLPSWRPPPIATRPPVWLFLPMECTFTWLTKMLELFTTSREMTDYRFKPKP